MPARLTKGGESYAREAMFRYPSPPGLEALNLLKTTFYVLWVLRRVVITDRLSGRGVGHFVDEFGHTQPTPCVRKRRGAAVVPMRMVVRRAAPAGTRE